MYTQSQITGKPNNLEARTPYGMSKIVKDGYGYLWLKTASVA
jgi:hypothetical protein